MRLSDIQEDVLYFNRTDMSAILDMQRKESDKAINSIDPDTVANLPFRIKSRGDSTQTYVAPLKRKQMVFQRKAVSESFRPEPTLDEGDYQHILKVIEGMTQTMERSPSTFAKLDEEALRDMYLALLWQIFWIDRRNWIPESDFQ